MGSGGLVVLGGAMCHRHITFVVHDKFGQCGKYLKVVRCIAVFTYLLNVSVLFGLMVTSSQLLIDFETVPL